jgi:hypothetical protein
VAVTPDLLNRCVQAYVAVDRRKRGKKYKGPSVLDILEQEGMADEPGIFGIITEAGNRAVERDKDAQYPDGYICEGCGKSGFASSKSVAQHQARWCKAGDPLGDAILTMREAGVTYTDIRAHLRVSHGRIARVVERARREGAA